MSELVIRGVVAAMVDGDTSEPAPGRVWIRDDVIVAVTGPNKTVPGFAQATVVDVGKRYVLPGFIDMHNHLAYNALPLWSEPGRTEPWLHNKHWPDATTYTESITEPAWVYAKACPEALLAYVQLRAMAGGATAVQGWPTANRGYQTVMRNVDAEQVDTGRDDLIYTSVVTKTGDALATAVRRMGDGAGFIYHCAEGRQTSRVLRDYTDLENAEGLLPTLIAIHCCAVDAQNWAKWAAQDAGGVVWSPLSNLVLYAQTTLIDHARAQGVRICLGSDWGPSGTKNLLGEMKVAKLVAKQLGYNITDRDIVEMVTTNAGVLLERCWHRPIGQLVEGAFADITVLRGRGTGSAWKRIVAATERDVSLVVIDGVPRYGDAALMHDATAQPTFAMTLAGRKRAVALPDPANPAAAWSWSAIKNTLDTVQQDPQTAINTAQARAAAGPRFADDAALELFLDMPDTRRAGRAGPPKNPATVTIPPVPSLIHDTAFFNQLDRCPIHGGVLSPIRNQF
ncbi:amidohydrolase family protein [Aeromicrobium sp.]|uniref:amidohydrolase family protein n=1 Tax=Aeromicrobium sp. TaxID=1871063 RepID=UPI002FC5ED09